MKNLGLIHLIVVSGAHLSFFEHTLLTPLSRLLPLFLRAKMIFAGLVFYSFVAGLQAPLVRALFQKVLISGPLSVRIFISAGLSMVFFRDCSLSLLLSWACSLLITWPALSNPFGKSLFVLLGLYPLLLPLGAPELQSAMLQPLFSLFFGFFVFPATVLGVFLPIDHVVHGIWSGFFALLKHSHHFQFEMHFFRYQSFPSFFYVLLLQLLHWRSEIFAQRERLNH